MIDIFPTDSRSLLTEALKDVIKEPDIKIQTLPAVFNGRLIETRVAAIMLDSGPVGWSVVLVP